MNQAPRATDSYGCYIDYIQRLTLQPKPERPVYWKPSDTKDVCSGTAQPQDIDQVTKKESLDMTGLLQSVWDYKSPSETSLESSNIPTPLPLIQPAPPTQPAPRQRRPPLPAVKLTKKMEQSMQVAEARARQMKLLDDKCRAQNLAEEPLKLPEIPMQKGFKGHKKIKQKVREDAEKDKLPCLRRKSKPLPPWC